MKRSLVRSLGRCAAGLVLALALLPAPGRTAYVRTLAGTSTAQLYNGDGISATSANFNGPMDFTYDSQGNIYIADFDNNRIRKVTLATGVVSTIAGTGSKGYNGDGILATSAWLNEPDCLTWDPSGNLVFSDQANQRIRKINMSTGMITTLVGTGAPGYNGDNIAATTAQVYNPAGVVYDASGNLYFADEWNVRIRKVSPGGIITTIAGTSPGGYNGDGISATAAFLDQPGGLVLDAAGNPVFSDSNNHRIRKVDLTTGLISTLVGNGVNSFTADGSPGVGTAHGFPCGLAYDPAGNLIFAEQLNRRVRMLSAATGLVTTIAGNGTATETVDGTAPLATGMNSALLVHLDPTGAVAYTSWYRLRRVCTQDISVTKFASTATPGAGQTVTYRMVVTNTGYDTIVNLLVVDTVPGGFSFTGQTSTPAMTWNGNTVTSAWTGLGLNLAPGRSVTITMDATAGGSGVVINTVLARAYDAIGQDIKTASRSVTVTALPGPTLNWSRTCAFNASSTLPYASAVDPCGNLVVAGWETVGGQTDWSIRSYLPDGSVRWSTKYVGSAGGSDQAQGVATDSTGNVIVGGWETVAGQGLNWLLRKYDPSGSLLWSAGYNSPANGNDDLWSVAVDGGGNVYAVGSEARPDRGEALDWLVRKYDSNGALLWSRTYTPAPGLAYNHEAYGCASDAAGNLVVVGYEQPNGIIAQWRIFKYTPSGTVLWSRTYAIPPSNSDERASRVALGAGGEVYVAGSELPTTWPNYDWRVTAYDAAGHDLWTDNFVGPAGNSDAPQAITVMPDGTVVVGGDQTVSGAGKNWLVRGYAPSGALLWSLTYGGAALGTDECFAVSADANGNLYVVGDETVAGGGRWLIKRFGAAVVPPCGAVTPPPPPPADRGSVKIVGGIRGYISPKQGEQANILVKPSGPGTIQVRIYDRLGRLVRELAATATGTNTVVLKWDATDATGQAVPAGIYPVVVEAPGVTYHDKLAVLR